MREYTHGRVSHQVRDVRRRMLEEQDLCFGSLLPAKQIETALTRHQVRFRDRL